MGMESHSKNSELKILNDSLGDSDKIRDITSNVLKTMEKVKFLESENKYLKSMHVSTAENHKKYVDSLVQTFETKLTNLVEEKKKIENQRDKALNEMNLSKEENLSLVDTLNQSKNNLEAANKKIEESNDLNAEQNRQIKRLVESQNNLKSEIDKAKQELNKKEERNKLLGHEIDDLKILITDKSIETGILEEKLNISKFISNEERHIWDDQQNRNANFSPQGFWQSEVEKAIDDIETRYNEEFKKQKKESEKFFNAKVQKLSEMNAKTLNKLNELKVENQSFERLTNKLKDQIELNKNLMSKVNREQAEKIFSLEKSLQSAKRSIHNFKEENSLLQARLKSKDDCFNAVNLASPAKEIDALGRIAEMPKNLDSLLYEDDFNYPVVKEVGGKYVSIANQSNEKDLDISKWGLMLNDSTGHKNIHTFHDNMVLKPGEVKRLITHDFDGNDEDIKVQDVNDFGYDKSSLMLVRCEGIEGTFENMSQKSSF